VGKGGLVVGRVPNSCGRRAGGALVNVLWRCGMAFSGFNVCFLVLAL